MLKRLLKLKTKVVKEIGPRLHKGTFTLTPLEPGYGTTLGNSLRRMLLSSIDGYAITHIRLPSSIPHVYASIDGVYEEMSDILLNLKQVRFQLVSPYKPGKITINIGGSRQFRAKDIEKSTDFFRVVNPDLVICNMAPNVSFSLDILISKGRGYIMAENNNLISKADLEEKKFLPVDAYFSPVKNVSIEVKNILVGHSTNHDKLIIKVDTDGSITAEEALQQAAELLVSFYAILCNPRVLEEAEVEEKEMVDKEFLRTKKLLNTPIEELNLSTRVNRTLAESNIHSIKRLSDIVKLDARQIVMMKSLGKKSIDEIKKLLEENNLTFGMNVDKYNLDNFLD